MKFAKLIFLSSLLFLTSCKSLINSSFFSSSNSISSNYIDNNSILYFDFDSYKLKNSSKNFITSNIIDLLGKNPNLSVIISGHTDERGTESYNYKLGKNRANEVRKFLLLHNINDSRIKIVSYGETMPVDSASNKKAWKQNRRAVIKLKQKN